MYTVAVKTGFSAQHFLVGGDWGAENQKHTHYYEIEVLVEGNSLNEHGYLLDIDEIKNGLSRATSYFRDKTLNELPEFLGINPSIEHLARVIHGMLFGRIQDSRITTTRVKVWEDADAWASYREEH
ncbi:MAG: 6-carboxytetrahydropterin synthase [Smithella sp.]